MRTVAPRIDGVDEVTLAEDQHEFRVVVVGRVPYADGSVGWVTRWRLSEWEKEAVWSGGDIFVELLGGAMQPLAVTVGPPPHLTRADEGVKP